MNQSFVDAFAALDSLYIADGHHRAASAARTRSTLNDESASSVSSAALKHRIAPNESVLAVAFPDNQMQVLPYNRVVRICTA